MTTSNDKTFDLSDPNTVIWRPDLQDMCKVSSETIRRWMKEGKLPKPDVAITSRTMGWRASTLRSAGINLA